MFLLMALSKTALAYNGVSAPIGSNRCQFSKALSKLTSSEIIVYYKTLWMFSLAHNKAPPKSAQQVLLDFIREGLYSKA
jgi:hypothetical protein